MIEVGVVKLGERTKIGRRICAKVWGSGNEAEMFRRWLEGVPQ